MAQSTAQLTGTVVDPSDAVIPGVKLVCKSIETGFTATASTNSAGLFRFPELPVGQYELTASHDGFATLARGGIELLTGQTLDVTLSLRLGQASQTVEVDERLPLVQSTTSEVQTSVDSRQMADLPLNGRNAFELAVLVAGAVITNADTIPGQQDNDALAVNGLRSTQNQWELDGSSYVNRGSGSAPTLPNPDTLREFTVRTSLFSAETRGGGASVKMATRSGTNQFHGTAFEFLRNDYMDARNFFSAMSKAELYKLNQYGGTLGGPIRRNKLFFFASVQQTTQIGGPSPRSMTVATAAQRLGDFSGMNTIVDPLTGLPFPGNKIPQARMDPIAVGLLKYVPLPNKDGNMLWAPPESGKNDFQWLIKLDYVLGAKDHLWGRFFKDGNDGPRDNNSMPGFSGWDYYKNQTLAVSETHTFSTTWVMRLAFNHLRTFRTATPNAATTMQALGAKVPPASTPAQDCIVVNLNPYTKVHAPGGGPQRPESYEFNSEFSHAAGRHFIRFGFDYRRNTGRSRDVGAQMGQWNFTAARTTSAAIRGSGDTIASFLLGLPNQFNQNSSAPADLVVKVPDAWLQDDWKIHRRLTLNMGMRWDPWVPPTDNLGPLVGFVPGMKSTRVPLSPVGLVWSGDPGIPDSILRSHWGTFAPRVGFAWDVVGSGRTVVRGGYGIFRFTSEFIGMARQFGNNTPGRSAAVNISTPSSTADPYATYAGTNPFPFTGVSIDQLANYRPNANLSVRAFDPNAKGGYVQNWNLTIERRVLRDTAVSIAYVGNHYLNSITTYNANPARYGPDATASNILQRRIYPGFSDINFGTSYDKGFYNGLQVNVMKRARQGLTLLANYTFSKAINLNASSGIGGALNDAPRCPFNLALDKGLTDFDVKHQAKIAAIYDLPRLRSGNAVVRGIANNWQVNAIIIARTGFPYTCRSGVDNSLSGVANDTCDQVLTDISPPPGSDPLLWVNPAAFTVNAVGSFGMMGRNTLRRPGVVNVDMSVFRQVRIREQLNAELRVEAFNALNHTNFDLFYGPNGYSASQTLGTAFGRMSHARDGRLLQVALKLRF